MTIASVKNLFSFETVFVLFLFSYQYKNAHPLFLNPDITLALIGILIPWAFVLGRKSSQRMLTPSTISLLLFSIWCVVSAFLAPKSSYTISKALCFVVYTLPAFFMGYKVIGADPERIKRFFIAIAVFAILVHFEAYRAFYYSGGYIFDVLGNNYLVTGQTLGCGFILLVVDSLFCIKSKNDMKGPYWALMLLCGTFFYIQLNLGGRGPVAGVALVLITFYVYGITQISDRKLYLCHLFHLTLVCALSYWLLKWLFTVVETNHFFARTTAMIITPELDDPINFRIGYYKSAIEAFLTHPLRGVGFGRWVQYHDMGSLPWKHPHNIILEVLSETGVIGGALGAWFSWNVLKNISYKNLNHSFLKMGAVYLFLFSAFNALKSGDLNDNILLFVMAGIILGQVSLTIFYTKEL